MKLNAAALCLLIALAASAALNASALNSSPMKVELSDDLRTLARVVAVSRDLSDQRPVLKAILDDDIEKLREPRGDGTYRWASLQREEDGRVTEEKGRRNSRSSVNVC